MADVQGDDADPKKVLLVDKATGGIGFFFFFFSEVPSRSEAGLAEFPSTEGC